MTDQNFTNDADPVQETDLTLEEAFLQIETILTTMEKPDISLSESFAAYEKGIALLKFCNEKIDRVEKQMIVLRAGLQEQKEE